MHEKRQIAIKTGTSAIYNQFLLFGFESALGCSHKLEWPVDRMSWQVIDELIFNILDFFNFNICRF